MLLSAWSADSFHSPSPMSCLKMNLRSWLCEASGAWISFSCGWQPTEIRTVDRHRKTRSYVSTNERLWLQAITKLHQKVPGRASRAIQSLSYMIYIFFFSLPGGEGSSDDLFKWFSCFFQVVTMQNSESSGLFVHFIQGFSEQSYVILFYDAQKLSLVWNHVRACCRSWYLYMTIYYYYLFVLVLRSLFQGFPKTGSFDFGVLGDVIWPHLVSMNT